MHDSNPLIGQFLTYLIDERHFSPYTSRCYGLDLRQFAEYLTAEHSIPANQAAEEASLKTRNPSAKKTVTDWLLLGDVEVIRAYLTKMAEQNYSPATTARKIATLRSFHKWMEKRGYIGSNPMTLIRTPKQPRRLPKAISVDQIEKLLAAPSDGEPPFAP